MKMLHKIMLQDEEMFDILLVFIALNKKKNL